LEILDALVNRQNAFSAQEYFLGHSQTDGKYRVFKIGDAGSLGGALPEGQTPIAHSHPGGAVLTYEDLATTTTQGKSVGGVRTHLVAMGNGNFTVIEVPANGPATATSLNVATGKVSSIVELAPPGPTQTSPVPYVEGTGRTVSIQTPIKGYDALANAVNGSTPLRQLFNVPPAAPVTAPKASKTTPAAESTPSRATPTPKVESKAGPEPSAKTGNAPKPTRMPLYAPGTPGVTTMDPKPRGWAVVLVILWEVAGKPAVETYWDALKEDPIGIGIPPVGAAARGMGAHTLGAKGGYRNLVCYYPGLTCGEK
jgi:hypothetical protein